MFASKRSIRKAAIKNGKMAAKEQPKHNNKKITPGRLHRIQTIKGKDGFISKTLMQYSPRKLRAIKAYSEMLAQYKAQQMIENGQVPIINETGKDVGNNEAETPKLETEPSE